MTDMQPEISQTQGGPEQQPISPNGNSEHIPVLPTPEVGIETGAERVEQTAEAQAAVADAATVSTTPVIPVVAPVTTPQDPPTSSPAVAADEDVIEKEWVDKAKSIILQTKDDPHSRTEKVNQLQKDYLKKRYGKELGAA